MFEIEIIETSCIKADGGAMFGAIPKRAWQRKYPSDENNLCPLAMRCLLVTGKGKRILIDLGLSDKHLDKIRYYQPHNLKNIGEEILKFGVSAEDITDVILTHLHFDHCDFATRNNGGTVVPSFPNAKYWLSQKQWDTMFAPSLLEKDSFFEDNILPVFEAGLLNLIERDVTLCDGLELQLFDGHTQGQIVALISTSEGTVAFPGDLIPTAAHVALEWISAYDISAETSVNEKSRFLKSALENNYTLVYCHDVIVRQSKVKKLNDNYIAFNAVKV